MTNASRPNPIPIFEALNAYQHTEALKTSSLHALPDSPESVILSVR